jgi:hypothetical protein
MASPAHHARWIREEAAMAAITFDTARRERAFDQLKSVFTAFHQWIDASVSNWIRQAAAEAGHANAIEKRVMTNVQLTVPCSPSRKRIHASPADHAEIPALQFGPLDPSVVSEAIPAFFIGRNQAGFWVAREAKGRIGGLFLLKRSAVAFAHAQGGIAGCATIFPAERFELDLKNEGNPFAVQLAPLVRFATALSGRSGNAP